MRAVSSQNQSLAPCSETDFAPIHVSVAPIITQDRRQSKTLLTNDEHGSKNETLFSILISY